MDKPMPPLQGVYFWWKGDTWIPRFSKQPTTRPTTLEQLTNAEYMLDITFPATNRKLCTEDADCKTAECTSKDDCSYNMYINCRRIKHNKSYSGQHIDELGRALRVMFVKSCVYTNACQTAVSKPTYVAKGAATTDRFKEQVEDWMATVTAEDTQENERMMTSDENLVISHSFLDSFALQRSIHTLAHASNSLPASHDLFRPTELHSDIMDQAITGRDIHFDETTNGCASHMIVFEDMAAQVYDMKNAQDNFLAATQRIERAINALVREKNVFMSEIDLLADRLHADPASVVRHMG